MAARYLDAGRLRLDCRDERLWLDDQPVRLGGKALALLRLLMEQPQMLVTKDAIFETVWHGLAVSDSVLTTAIKEIRQAIGDSARRPVFVETVHGRGYRFIPPVVAHEDPGAATSVDAARVVEALSPPVPSRRRWGRATRIGAVAMMVVAIVAALFWWLRDAPLPVITGEDRSIVVLPLDDLSPGQQDAWFAEGLTEEILNSLARIPDVRVASRIAGAQLKRSSGDIQTQARKMGFAYFLEGSVRHTENRVRVSAQLIRVADGGHVWAQSFDRPANDVIAIQEEVAFRIASAMKTALNPARVRQMVTAGTRSVEAYQAFLRGRAFDQRQLDTGSIDAARAAAQSYELARTIDPGFAEAHWLAARNWFGNDTRVDAAAIGTGMSEQERLQQYRDRINAAIDSAGDTPERLKYMASRNVVELRFTDALAALQAYVIQRPRDIAAWDDLVTISAYAGRRDITRQAADRLQRLSIEAGNPVSRAITASVLALDYDGAVDHAREQLRLRPDNALLNYQAHRALLSAGEYDAARALVPGLIASNLPDDTKQLVQIRQFCADGRTIDARALIDTLKAGDVRRLNPRWQALMTIGARRSADSLLRPLDTPERLTALMQYLVYPEFNVSAFPTLAARLRADGIGASRPAPIPYACRQSSDQRANSRR